MQDGIGALCSKHSFLGLHTLSICRTFAAQFENDKMMRTMTAIPKEMKVLMNHIYELNKACATWCNSPVTRGTANWPYSDWRVRASYICCNQPGSRI